MRNNKGISMIALIITIIVIIILAAIIFIASGNTIGSANYSVFSQEFGDYSLNFQNDALADVRLKYGTQGKVISNPQAIYLASNPANTITDGLLIPAGVEFVTALGDKKLYNENKTDVTVEYWGTPTSGSENDNSDIACYELADNAIEGYKKPQFYGDNLGEEKHYVTQNGFVFTVPGYPREVDGENRMYISAGVYYLAGEDYQEIIDVEQAKKVPMHKADGVIVIDESESLAQLKIGDWVDYKTDNPDVAGTDNCGWRVWAKEGDNVVIKPVNAVGSLKLGENGNLQKCFENWRDSETKINEACKAYTKAELGITAGNIRSLKIEDLEDKLESPKKPATFSSRTYTSGQFGAKLQGVKNVILDNLVTATEGSTVEVQSDYWGGTPTWKKIPDSTEVTYGDLVGSSVQWLASPCVKTTSDRAYFDVHNVGSGDVSFGGLFTSAGSAFSDSYGLAPLVSLSSKLIKTTSGDGKTSSSAWHLELAD